MPPRKNDTADSAVVESGPEPDAPFGWDVVGDDDRRIARWQSRTDADEIARRITAATEETITVVPSTVR